MSDVQNPKSVSELVKLLAKHGKRAFLVSGVDISSDKAVSGKVIIDVSDIESLQEIAVNRDNAFAFGLLEELHGVIDAGVDNLRKHFDLRIRHGGGCEQHIAGWSL